MLLRFPSFLQFGEVRYRLELFIQSKASDGMDINRYYNFDWTDPNGAPSDKEVFEAAQAMRKELEALVAAPLVEPYAGPALLTGRAAAVFFHEVFGHRAEGHRQKDVNEGQTFAKKVGEQILPSFISIDDDPTTKRIGKQDLLGYYPYDDEGVQAVRVLSSIDADLTAAAVDAVKQWRYSPTLLNGVPVETLSTIDVQFKQPQQ